MPSKLQLYTKLADHTAARITGSFQQWTSFLTTAARLYKYPYHEQLMIYAQRPEATACAGYELWNKQMGRYIRRDSRGIALIDTSGDTPKLKYVFDVADTSGRENSRRLFLWEYRPEEHEAAVTDALEQRFNIPSVSGLDYQLEQIAFDLASDFWERNKADILDILADSFLEEYDDHTIEVAFKNAVTVSTTYALMSRCGLEPERFFQHEDFMPVFDFNTPQTVAALGSAVSQISEQVLRQIEVTIKKFEREQSRVVTAERTDTHDRTVYLDDKPFEITEVGDYNVQLRDPALSYPIFRAESKENFEQLLRKDYRNGPITEFLSADLNSTDWNLMNVLTGDGGLLGKDGKELVANWIRAGYGNTKVMQLLSEQFAGIEDSMKLATGSDVDYRAYTTSLEISLGGEGNPKQSFKWEEIAPVLRAMYQLELVGFSHEPAPRPSATLEGTPVYQVGDEVTFPYGDRLIHGKIHHIGELAVLVDTGPYSWSSQSVNREYFDELLRSREENAHLFAPEQAEPVRADDSQPQFTTEAETVYPAEGNHLPYDVVIERLHVEKPEPTPPTPADDPVSVPIDGKWQAFPNAQAAEQAAYEEYKACGHSQ